MENNQQNTCINVLDHGYVRLVDSMGSDLSVVRSARVSYDADWRAGEDQGSDARLINYLVKNKHTSPLESVQFTFEVKCPIFVARQWMRHRSWGFNEVSARYSELPEEMYVPAVGTIGSQNKDNKQMRDFDSDFNREYEEAVAETIRAANAVAYNSYRALIAANCPREIARGVLPVNIYTHFFGTVDLHNLLHFLKLRDHDHAQHEIRVYASAIRDLIAPIVPVTMAAFNRHILGASE